MKPQHLKMSTTLLHSFSVRRDSVPYFFSKWHYHSEIELVLIEKGSGSQFIGDHISRFNDGDIFLIGSNLPHYWRCDENYFQNDPDLKAEATVVHFEQDFWGTQFLQLLENRHIKELLLKSKNGIKISGLTNRKVAGILKKLLEAETTERVFLLLQALHIVASSHEIECLASAGFETTYNESETERINNIIITQLIISIRK